MNSPTVSEAAPEARRSSGLEEAGRGGALFPETYRLQFYDDSGPMGDFTEVQTVTVAP